MESSEEETITTIQLNKLKERIPYNENVFENESTYENTLNRLLEDSTFIGLSLRFPFDETQTELPNYSKYANWQLRCSVELYNLLLNGNSNFTQYSENGVSWTRDSSMISSSLANEIMPMIGVPKRSSEDDTNE